MWLSGRYSDEGNNRFGMKLEEEIFLSVLFSERFGLERYSTDCRSMVDGEGKEVREMYSYSQYLINTSRVVLKYILVTWIVSL